MYFSTYVKQLLTDPFLMPFQQAVAMHMNMNTHVHQTMIVKVSYKQLSFYTVNEITPFYNTQQNHSSFQHVSITKFFSVQSCNKRVIVRKRSSYHSNQPHTRVTFPLQAHYMSL